MGLQFGFQGMAKCVIFTCLKADLDKALHYQTSQVYLRNLDSVSCGIVHLLHILKPLRKIFVAIKCQQDDS